MLSSKFAPTIIAIFTAIIGFYVTTVVEEIRSGSAIVYDVQRGESDIKLTLRNVSRSSTVKDLEIGLICKDRKIFCFHKDVDNPDITYFAPVTGTVKTTQKNEYVLELKTTLVPGAAVLISQKSNASNLSEPLFVYFPFTKAKPVSWIDRLEGLFSPVSSAPAPPVFLKQGEITTWLVENYFATMTLAMSVSVLLLVVIIVVGLFKTPQGKEPQGKENNANVQTVTVNFIHRGHWRRIRRYNRGARRLWVRGK